MKKKIGVLFIFCALTGSAGAEWYENIKLKGDARLREEYIDQDGKEERNRFRIRLRLQADAKVNDYAKAYVRLASGSDDPVSTNQSFDGGASSKAVRLDRAALVLTPMEGMSITGGKMANPFRLVKDLLWDSDLNPEGFALSLEQGPALVNLGAFLLEERSSEDDTYMFGAQAAIEQKSDDLGKILAGVGYFAYTELEGFEPFIDDDAFGNSTVTVGEGEDETEVFANDIGTFEAFFKYSLPTEAPITVYSDFALNTEVDSDDFGYQAGVTYGKAKDPGTWQVDYNYRDLEKDAVFAAWTDSDFAGGGTNGSGHRAQGKYQIDKNLQTALTLLFNELDPDGDDIDYFRLQLDLIAKF